MHARDHYGRATLPTQLGDEPIVLPAAQVLAATRAILDERNVDVGEHVEVGTAAGGHPFAWDVERRALLRAELDAYYARLYGLTRKQLRYILDPRDLTDRELAGILDPAEDPPDAPCTTTFPGKTFRVLKERETREYGGYRTKRLVLAAWDALHRD